MLAPPVPAQPVPAAALAPAPAPAYTIPFQLRRGLILLDARVDGSPVTLILDTGSSASTLDSGLARSMALPAQPRGAVARGVGDVKVELATVRSLRIGMLELQNERIALVPLGTVSEALGAPIGGTLGYPFFARWAVEIDYSGRVLRLYEPASYTWRGPELPVPVDLAMRIPIAAAQVTPEDGPPLAARLVLDLGTSGYGVILNATFTETHEASFRSVSLGRPLGHGVGGSMPGRVGRLASADLGSLHVAAPTVALAQEKKGFLGVTWADGTLGAPIFERTTLIVDYSRSQVIFAPGAGFGAPFPFDASGLDLVANAPAFDEVRVDAVTPGSPAAEAGVETGDRLLALDGQPVSGSTLADAVHLLETAGSLRRLTLLRGSRRFDVALHLRKLL